MHYIISIILIYLAFFFRYHPELDLALSKLFYHHGQFYSIHIGSFMLAIIAVSGIAIILYFIIIWKRYRSLHIKHYRSLIYILTCILLGPVLLVHWAIKNWFGRPRPYSIIEFGGDVEFVPAFTLSQGCSNDCSFVSGHTSLVFMLLTLTFIPEINQRYKKIVLILTLSLGLLVGTARVAAGEHFLSDIVFGAGFSYFVCLIMHHVFLVRYSSIANFKL